MGCGIMFPRDYILDGEGETKAAITLSLIKEVCLSWTHLRDCIDAVIEAGYLNKLVKQLLDSIS